MANRPEPKNEVELCERVIAMVAARLGAELKITEHPDRDERNEEAVEMVCTSASGQSFAIEHTRIESFGGQIGDGYAFSGLLEPLEAELEGRLPGRFSLTVAVGAAAGVKGAEYPKIRELVKEWVLAQADGLKDGSAVTAAPPRVPFPVTLSRRHSDASVLLISRFAPDDLETKRQTRVQQAIDRKYRKLAREKAKGRESILILESNDIALGNSGVVGDAVAKALATCPEPPDRVYLVETDGRPWYLYRLKEGADIYPNPRLHDYNTIEI